LPSFVSITRLRLRSLRFLPRFAVLAGRTLRQVKAADGFQGGSLLADRRQTFWTLTLWDTAESMRAYMMSGPHGAAMPFLVDACDEASVAHWTQPDPDAPDWSEAARRMRAEGRPSKLRRPSADHAALTFSPPRLTRIVPITPNAKA
jgi:hypothetical protein